MPHIQVTAPQGAFSKQDQDALIARLSNALLKAEGAPIEDADAQSLVWAHYVELPAGCSYVGGEAIAQPPLRVAVTTPEGALTHETRKALVTDIGAIVDEIFGTFEGRLNHWAMLYEVIEGGWAGGGEIFSLAGIQAAMNIKSA
jgi:phenylpyruvate tautomerase PptA (4-oxalocrotonate tautomerase family)